VSLRDTLLSNANLVAEVDEVERQLPVLIAWSRAVRTGSADSIQEEKSQELWQRHAELREAVKQHLRSAIEERSNQS